MDFLTLIGLGIGASAVYYVMKTSGIQELLYNMQAFVLVFGGTFASTIMTYPWAILKRVPRATLLIFFPPKTKSPKETIEEIVHLSEIVKRAGIDSLEMEYDRITDRFLLDGLKMIVNGLSPDLIRENLEKEIAFTRIRHQQIANVFRSGGTYAPVFGLLGTLIGVVQILKNLTDPKSLGAAMAIAVTTTFYGIFGANFVFLPLAGKLTAHSDAEILLKEVIIEGILALQSKEVPAIVELKLQAYLAQQFRETAGSPEQQPIV
ncbi:MAG TPA: MotA/TolQ/ExbB proton channel family protein [Elusimicrobiota bacterium]|nr:MotA/TolQ/ExbB proton channel family protein [Elusimicrobiota bacterium]